MKQEIKFDIIILLRRRNFRTWCIKVKRNFLKNYNKNDIAFDHALIIYTSIEQLKNKISYTDVAFNLRPEYFTLGDL